jgi:hypothetical protein
MSAPTIETAAPTSGAVAPRPEPLFDPRPFACCAPWCSGEHWDGDGEDAPGVCFARDIDVPFRGSEVSAAMSYDPQRIDHGKADVSLTVFLASRDILQGLSFTDLDEAQVAAYALLAMIAVARGDQAAADRHHLAALDAAKGGAR